MASQIKSGAVISYAAVAFNAVAGILYTPWMVSTIGADDYALYTLALSVVNMFLMDFGLSTSVSRFLSKYYAEGREDLANEFLGVVYKLFLALSVAIFAVLVAVYANLDAIYASYDEAQLGKLRGIFLIVSLYSVVSFPCLVFNGVLTANERFVALNLLNLLQKVSCVLLIVAALLLGSGVYGLVLANACTSVLFSLAKYLVVRRRTGARARMSYWSRDLLRETAGFSVWVVVSQVSGRLTISLIPSVLAIVSENWEVTVFGLASSLEGYVYTAASALGGMFLPKVTRVLHEDGGGTEGLQALMARVGRIELYVTGLLICGFLCLGDRFVGCWMGEGYSAVYLCALILMAPSLVELPATIGTTALTASGNVRASALVYLSAAVVNVLLSFPLAARWGALGASVSILLAYLTRFSLMNVMYARKLGLRPLRFLRETFGSWVLPAAVVVAAFLVLDAVFPIGGWAGLVLLAASFCLCYLLAVTWLSFDGYERGLFKSIVIRGGKS